MLRWGDAEAARTLATEIEIGIAAVKVTAQNVAIQFDNTGTT